MGLGGAGRPGFPERNVSGASPIGGVTHPRLPQTWHGEITPLPRPGCHIVRWQPKGYEQMFRTHHGILTLLYLAGALSFAYYDLLVRANSDLGSLIAYGAAWPLHVWNLV